MNSISIILYNCNNQNNFLIKLINFLNQPINIDKIYLFDCELCPEFHNEFDNCETINYSCSNSFNKFLSLLTCNSDYLFLIENNTLPAKNFLTKCFSSLEESDGLYGTYGYRFLLKNNSVACKNYVSGDGISKRVVDCLSGNLFFKREHINLLINNLSDYEKFEIDNANFHFSYVLQKNNINTYLVSRCIQTPNIDFEIKYQDLLYYINFNFSLFYQRKVDRIRENKDLFMEKLWKYYKGRKWNKLIFYSKIYISLFKECNYNNNLARFFRAYSEFELLDYINCKNHYLEIMNNSRFSEDSRMWSTANYNIIPVLFIGDDKYDLNIIFELIKSDKNFALTRYTYNNLKDANMIKRHDEDNYYYGSPISRNAEKFNMFLENQKLNKKRVFSSNIFSGYNLPNFLNNLNKLECDVVIISSGLSFTDRYLGMDIIDKYEYDINNQDRFKELRQLAKKHTDKLFLIINPDALKIVDALYNENCYNKYVDIGSSLNDNFHKRNILEKK